MSEWRIEQVADDDEAALGEVRVLFAEYHEWLGQVVCSARLAEEIASLPGPYASPSGRLWLARSVSGEPVGCIGLRRHEDDRAEIKRLSVRPSERGSGLGSALVAHAIEAARAIGYREALITTLPEMMPVAASMYARLGFEQTEAFFDHSHVGEDVPMSYLRLAL